MKRTSILSIILLLLISSCQMSIEKRRYNKGYHIDIIETRKADQLPNQDHRNTLIKVGKLSFTLVNETTIQNQIYPQLPNKISHKKNVSPGRIDSNFKASSLSTKKKFIFGQHHFFKIQEEKGDIAKQRKAIAWSMGVLFVGFIISGSVLAALSGFTITLLYIGIAAFVLALVCLAIFLWAILDKRYKNK